MPARIHQFRADHQGRGLGLGETVLSFRVIAVGGGPGGTAEFERNQRLNLKWDEDPAS